MKTLSEKDSLSQQSAYDISLRGQPLCDRQDGQSEVSEIPLLIYTEASNEPCRMIKKGAGDDDDDYGMKRSLKTVLMMIMMMLSDVKMFVMMITMLLKRLERMLLMIMMIMVIKELEKEVVDEA